MPQGKGTYGSKKGRPPKKKKIKKGKKKRYPCHSLPNYLHQNRQHLLCS